MKRIVLSSVVVLALGMGARAEDLAPATETSSPSVAAEATPAVSAATLEVLSATLGTGVDRATRLITGEATSFDAGVGQVYLLTQVKASSVPTTLKHVWSVAGQGNAEVPLTVKGSPWKTWSYRTVWPGDWKVEVQDEAGAVLQSLAFTVTKEAAVAPSAPEPMTSDPVAPAPAGSAQ